MRTSTAQRSVPLEDLSARARLREAAIEAFAVHGFEVSVREIAKAAGVSAGLITHHFGSKQALREVCDAEVLRRYGELKTEGVMGPPAETIGMLSRLDEFTPHFVYLLRSVREGGPAGRAFLEHVIDEARVFMTEGVDEGVIKPSIDPEARLRYLATMQLGGMLLQLDLTPGISLSDTTAAVRRLTEELALPALEFFTQGLLVDDGMLKEYLAYSERNGSTP